MSTNRHSTRPITPLRRQPSRRQSPSTRAVAHCRRGPVQFGARASAQSGAVLILGLVVLLVITLLGVTGINTTVMQERMAGNLRQNNLALQAAEAALQAGLTYIESQTSPPTANGSTTTHVWPSCTVADANAVGVDACTRLQTVLTDWNGVKAMDVDEAASYTDLDKVSGLSGVKAQPRFYIEERYVPPLDVDQAAQGVGVHYYTVTAVGFGGSDSARAIVQSTVAKVFQY